MSPCKECNIYILSNILYEACKESNNKDSNVKQQVRRIGNQFLNHVEIHVGAQEAVYLVLQITLIRSTREVVFIEDRTVLLNSASDLKDLPKNSTNIEPDNALKRYTRRPRTMENCCYADFVS